MKPSYRGRALIRGARLDAARSVRFGEGERLSRELRIRPGQTVRWAGRPAGSRGVPSSTRVMAPGCYGVQIDGASFSRTVVFTATAPSTSLGWQGSDATADADPGHPRR